MTRQGTHAADCPRGPYISAAMLCIAMLVITPMDAIGAGPDTDDDGLPDAYEDANGLDKLDPADALEDLDLDGFSSLSEFQAGTDPADVLSTPDDVFKVPPLPVFAAVLPLSRSAQIDSTVTAFATILNPNTAAATNCSIAPITPIPAEFYFYATDPATNAITGARNTPVDVPGQGRASFVFGLTPRGDIDSLDIALRFDCDNAGPASVYTGINTLLLSASSVAPPDVVALAATASKDGVLRIPDIANPGAFAVATVNVGAAGTLTARAVFSLAGSIFLDSKGAPVPGTQALTLSLCETNATTGQCINPTVPAQSVDVTINANATPTFSIFATAQLALPLEPASSRISVQFTDAGDVVRGATGVAIEALAPAPKLSELQATIFTPICSVCHSGDHPPAELSLDAGSSFSNLVNVTSLEQVSRKRVAPGDPDNSYIVRKLEGAPDIVGLQMPFGGPPLSAATIQKVRDWISAGAQNN